MCAAPPLRLLAGLLERGGAEREPEAGCHGSPEFHGEVSPCLWVPVEPCLPPKRLSARHC